MDRDYHPQCRVAKRPPIDLDGFETRIDNQEKRDIETMTISKRFVATPCPA